MQRFGRDGSEGIVCSGDPYPDCQIGQIDQLTETKDRNSSGATLLRGRVFGCPRTAANLYGRESRKLRSSVAKCRAAFPRWLIRFFSSGASCAAVLPNCGR